LIGSAIARWGASVPVNAGNRATARKSGASPTPFSCRRQGRFRRSGPNEEKPASAKAEHDVTHEVVKLTQAQNGFARLVLDCERCGWALADLNLVVFAGIMLENIVKLAAGFRQPERFA
jgi:hypothetical protein